MPVRSVNFAQFVEAPAFTSTATLVNPSRSNSAAALLAFRNSAGSATTIRLNGTNQAEGVQPAAVPPLGARFFSTDPQTSAANVGALVVASGRPLAGTVLFSGPGGVAGVGESELLTQFIAPFERGLGRGVNSGIALMNPSTALPATVQLRLRRNDTGIVQETSIQVPAGGQVARFVDELYGGIPGDLTGTLTATASAPVGATVIRVSPGQFATLPVTGTGSRRLLFAQFGEASGISSALTFVNPSSNPATATVRVFDDNGSPLAVNLDGSERQQFTVTLAPQSSATLSSPGTSALAKVGSVVVESSENIGGTILFGGAFGTAGVGASRELSSFVAPVEQVSSGAVVIGLALMNPGNVPATVTLTLRDDGGQPMDGGTTTVALKAQGHSAQFLSALFPQLDLKDFRGTISGESAVPIAATVIRQSAVPREFATLPVAEIIP